MHYIYEIRPMRDTTGVALISKGVPSGRVGFEGSNAVPNAIAFAKFYGRACDVTILIFDLDGNVVDEHSQKAAMPSRGSW